MIPMEVSIVAKLPKGEFEAPFFTFVQVMGRPNYHSRRILLQGLCTDAIYRNERDGKTYSGDALMYAGLNVENLWGDFRSTLIHLKKERNEDGFKG